MQSLARSFFFASLLALLAVLLARPLHASSFGLGVTAVALTKPDHGGSTVAPITNIYIEMIVNQRLAFGVAYSQFPVGYSDDYYLDIGGGDVDPDQTIISAYVSALFFERGPLTTFAKFGGGWYEGELAGDSESRAGIYAAAGERFYVARRVSMTLEVQYHFPSFGSSDSYPPTGELLRVMVSVEGWAQGRH